MSSLHDMLISRRKKVSKAKVLAFTKRLGTVCLQLDPVSQSRGTEIVADRGSRGGDTGDPGTTGGQRERERERGGSAEIVRTQMSLGDSGPSSSVTLLMSRNFGPNI